MLSIAFAVTAAATAQPGTIKAGVERWRAGDYPAAIAAWLPFAAQGDADACFNLGQAYKLGRGVPKDANIARDYYRRAALKGHLPAQANLGIALFQAGDKLEAVKWLKTAADRGEPRAQYVLGIAAYNGDGTPRNLGLAYGYLLRAQASGLAQATTALGSIEPALPPDARAAGQQMADSLAAGTGVPAALAASVNRTGPAGVQRPGTAPAPGIVATTVNNVRTALGLPPTPAKPPVPTRIQSADATPSPRAAPIQTDAAATPAPRPIVPSVAAPSSKPVVTATATPAPKPATIDAAGPPNPNDTAPAPKPVADATPSKPAEPAPKPAAIADAPPKPSPKPAKPALADAKPAAVKPAGWRVQLGAFSSQKQADAAWTSIKSSQAAAIGKAKPIFDASGPVVKFQLGPYASKDAARDTCAKLAFAGKACFVTQG